MRSTRAIVMILLALLAGVAAVILAARWAGQQAAENTTPIVVATRDLDLGTPLSAAMIQLMPWPSGAVPSGSFKELQQVDGRVVRTPMYKGEPLLEGKLAPVGTRGGLSSIIAGGKRAISVRVNEVVGVAGFALPGSYVDIMVNAKDSKDTAVSKIVLQRILVLAVAQEANRDETKPKVVNAVTLEVTPEEAEKIDLARSVGTLSLVLRNSVDKQDMQTGGVRRDDLLGAGQGATVPAKPQPAAKVGAAVSRPPKRENVEVIRGVQKANTGF